MAKCILCIEVNDGNIVDALKKIEKFYPNHIWNGNMVKPTEYIPMYAECLYLFDDNTITYGSSLHKNECKIIITAEEFCNKTIK